MNNIIQDLEVNATNGKENFCYISEKQLNAMKELYKREAKEIENLQQENKQLKEDIKNIIKILEKNCDDLEATEEEFDSLDKWQGLQVVELEQGSDSNE